MATRAETTVQAAEACYSKAAKAELDRDLDRAFRLYITAADDYLHISRSSSDAAIRANCKAQARKALERAEKIKIAKSDVAPVIRNHLSEKEQLLVLRKSSLVNNIPFPLWTERCPDALSSTQPPLSPEQIKHAATWRKPAPSSAVYSPSIALLPEDIVQHVVSDCSVCGAIAVCIEHCRRFKSKLGISCLHPQDADGYPIASEMGQYQVRMLFNGAYRRVSIDDQLPVYPDGTLICLSTGSSRQLWPSLIEKAYMKLNGGYDFPGSNSSIDLHALTGWIPEHVEIQSPQFECERTWRLIAEGFRCGRCVLTVGTGENVIPRGLPSDALLPAHSYAVIDIQETADDRQVTILDPWTPAHRSDLPEDDIGFSSLSIDGDQPVHSRSFNMSWETLCDSFHGIYASWDPGMFNNQLDFHGKWMRAETDDNDQSLHFQLLLQMELDASTRNEHDVWVLLTRHIVNTARKSEYIALSAQSTNSSDISSIALKGAYTNSTHVLAKTRCSSLDTKLSIVASYDGEHDDVGFTFTVYSSCPMAWVEDTVKMPHTEKVKGTLTSKNAGGNPTYPTFMTNPQYHLRIHPDRPAPTSGGRSKKAHTEITLQGDRHVPLNIAVIWSQGGRISEVSQNDVAVSSGAYNYGFARAVKDLPCGDYTVVVSAFEPRYLGPFSLNIKSSYRFDFKPVPQEGAGMFSKIVRGAWTEETAAGGPGFNDYASNPLFELKVLIQSQVKIRLQPASSGSSLSLNVTLFHLTQRRTIGPHIATSGAYADNISGVVTPQVTLQPGNYLVVPSTYSPGIQDAFRIIVYTTAAVVSIEPTKLGSSGARHS